jgi:hypothetical protein
VRDAVRQWWQRVAAIPYRDFFGVNGCGLHQPADVWLLGGGPDPNASHRRCTVTAGRPILAPVDTAVAEADLPSPSEPSGPLPNPGPMDIRLDGRSITPTEVANDLPYRVHAVPGALLRDGERISYQGYWVLLPGLTPGVHTLTIRIPNLRQHPYLEWTLTAS